MLISLKEFLSNHYMITYCIINLIFYIIATFYRIKYFDRHTGKFIPIVVHNKTATINLAAMKLTILLSTLILVIVIHLIKFITFGKFFIPKYKRIHRLSVMLVYFPAALFIFFPVLVFIAAIGLVVQFELNDLILEQKK